jgi:hypothetical protein
MADKFEEKLAAEEKIGRAARIDDAPPLGMRPDGTIEIYPPGEVPADDPKIIYGDSRDDEPVEGEYEDGDDLVD